MGKWLIVLPMLYAATLAADPAWTWVDANGRRHYSDRPVEGATRVELLGAQSFQSGQPNEPPRTARDATTPATSTAADGYRSFTISSPTSEETLWNLGGILNVTVAIEPALQAGHRMDAYLDGQRAVIAALSQNFTITDVNRGLHTLYAVIRDSSGREMRRSPEVTFMVQQTSVQNPPTGPTVRPPPPRPTPR